MSKSRPGRREVLALAALGGAAACEWSLPSAHTLSLDQTIKITLTSEDGELLKLPFPGMHTSVLSFWRPDCRQCKASLESVLGRRHELRALVFWRDRGGLRDEGLGGLWIGRGHPGSAS